MKQVLFSNWHLMRIINLVFGVFLIFQAFETHQWIFVIFAAFFLLKAFLNLGCCSNNCTIPKK